MNQMSSLLSESRESSSLSYLCPLLVFLAASSPSCFYSEPLLLLLWATASLSRLFSQRPLLSVISSLLAIFRSSLPENISLIWDWFILVSRATFCRANQKWFCARCWRSQARDSPSPGESRWIAAAGFHVATWSIGFSGSLWILQTFRNFPIYCKHNSFSKKHAIFIENQLKLFPSWFWLLVFDTHTHMCTSFFW